MTIVSCLLFCMSIFNACIGSTLAYFVEIYLDLSSCSYASCILSLFVSCGKLRPIFLFLGRDFYLCLSLGGSYGQFFFDFLGEISCLLVCGCFFNACHLRGTVLTCWFWTSVITFLLSSMISCFLVRLFIRRVRFLV